MAEDDTDVEEKQLGQSTADDSGGVFSGAPETGNNAFSDSQKPWQNPFTKMAENLPTPNYKAAIGNKQIRADQEIKAVEDQTSRMATDNQRLGAAAEAKNAQIQAVDPNQMTTWNAAEKQKQYSTSPFEAFGSAAMIASLGMAAFAKAPMTASLNAMAGVMNGIKESDDKAYDRDYAAWKENNSVFQKRFDLMNSQLTNDINLWKTKGEQGKQDLSNTLLKYGLYKQKATLDAGLDDVTMDYFSKQALAVSHMADAAQKIEDQHALVEAVKQDDARRVANGLPPKTAEESLQFKADAVRAATPEQREAQKAWREISNSDRYLKAQPEEKGKMFNDFWNQTKTSVAQAGVQSRIDKLNAEFLEKNPQYKTVEDIPGEEQVKIAQQAKAYKGPSDDAAAKSDLRKTLTAEAIAKKGGPLDAQEKQQIENKVNEKPIPGGGKLKLAENIQQAEVAIGIIDKVEMQLAKHGWIAGVGGTVRRPLESLSNKAFLSDSTAAADFEGLISMLRQMEPRLMTGGAGGRPLKAEAEMVHKIIRGLNRLNSAQSTISSLRTFKGLLRQKEAGWTALYNNNYNPSAPSAPPVMGGSTGQPAGKPLWMTIPPD